MAFASHTSLNEPTSSSAIALITTAASTNFVRLQWRANDRRTEPRRFLRSPGEDPASIPRDKRGGHERARAPFISRLGLMHSSEARNARGMQS